MNYATATFEQGQAEENTTEGDMMTESKYLAKAKELRACTTVRYNCGQSVILPFAEDAGLTEEQAMGICANFGGGLRRASACGAITAGMQAEKASRIFGKTEAPSAVIRSVTAN